jgi:hypothetical protein
VIFVYTFSQLIDHCVTWHTPHNTIGHTHAKMIVTALERQVSLGDTTGEVIDY